MHTRYALTIVTVLACLAAGTLASTGASVDRVSAEPGLSTAALPYDPQQYEPCVTKDPDYFDQGEIPFDPPWPRTGPVVTAPPVPVVRGPFESVQVNVDDNGNNIVGDAANEPSIAVDPTDPDRIVIGWRQFDDVRSNFRQAGYGYSHNGGKSWTFPGVVDPGQFRSDPVMDSDADGNFYFYNIRCPRSGCGDIFKSQDGGVSWAGPYFALGSDKTWMAVDRTDDIGGGHVYAAWGSSFIRSTDGGRAFQGPYRTTAMWGTIGISAEGIVYSVSGAENNYDAAVSRSTDARDPNQTPFFERVTSVNMGGKTDSFRGGSPNPGGLLGQPWIKVDISDGPRRDHLYVLQSVRPRNDPLDVMFTRSENDGQTWSGPVRVNDDPTNNGAWQWFGAMSVAANSGRIDATWFDTRNTSEARRSEMFYSYSTDGGQTWAENISVTPVFDSWIGWPDQKKIGDYDEMSSDQLGAMVAYAATFNDEQDVYFIRIAVDCNENGFHDGDDIASGRSKDVNGNGIPDECEGVNCNLIRKFKVICRRAKLKVKVKSKQPEGTQLTIDNNGDARVITLNGKGKAKTKWTRQTGKHTVKIVECPDFEEVVDCGQ